MCTYNVVAAVVAAATGFEEWGWGWARPRPDFAKLARWLRMSWTRPWDLLSGRMGIECSSGWVRRRIWRWV